MTAQDLIDAFILSVRKCDRSEQMYADLGTSSVELRSKDTQYYGERITATKYDDSACDIRFKSVKFQIPIETFLTLNKVIKNKRDELKEKKDIDCKLKDEQAIVNFLKNNK